MDKQIVGEVLGVEKYTRVLLENGTVIRVPGFAPPGSTVSIDPNQLTGTQLYEAFGYTGEIKVHELPIRAENLIPLPTPEQEWGALPLSQRLDHVTQPVSPEKSPRVSLRKQKV